MTTAGLVCSFFSFLLMGAGHGWFAPLYVSWIALPAGPLSVLTSKFRHSTGGLVILILLLLVAVGCDVFLFGPLGSDGDNSTPAHAWHAVPLWMTAWLLTWGAWQVIALAAVAMRITGGARRGR